MNKHTVLPIIGCEPLYLIAEVFLQCLLKGKTMNDSEQMTDTLSHILDVWFSF